MSQLQAILLVLAFALAVSLTIGVLVFVCALRYEVQARLRARRARRARPGFVTHRVDPATLLPPAPVYPLAMARSRREQRGGRPAA